MKTYYYEATGQQAGPVAGDQLRAHGVQGSTLVWQEEMSDWAPAASLVELAAFFQPVPPPLPKRLVPPPLPLSGQGSIPPTNPVSLVASSPAEPVVLGASTGCSVPQLGVFREDTAIYDLNSGELLAVFEQNGDLDRVNTEGLWYNEVYRFVLRDPTGKLLFTFYKPAKGFTQMLKHELHVLNAQNQLLGICRSRVLSFVTLSGKQDKIISVTDAYSQTLLELDSLTGLQAELTVEVVQRGQVVGSVVGSGGSGRTSSARSAYARDRFELRFKPEADPTTKAIGLGALLALHLFVRHRWR